MRYLKLKRQNPLKASDEISWDTFCKNTFIKYSKECQNIGIPIAGELVKYAVKVF